VTRRTSFSDLRKKSFLSSDWLIDWFCSEQTEVGRWHKAVYLFCLLLLADWGSLDLRNVDNPRLHGVISQKTSTWSSLIFPFIFLILTFFYILTCTVCVCGLKGLRAWNGNIGGSWRQFIVFSKKNCMWSGMTISVIVWYSQGLFSDIV
jgi:hypothetical protein